MPIVDFVKILILFKGGAVMIIKIIMIFIAGLIVDLLVAKYTSYIALRKTVMAALLSGIITVANFVFLILILKGSAGDSIFNVLAFAGGGSVGTFLALKIT